MRKDFGAKPILYPQPVMIIGTYNEDGTPNAMNAAWGGICGANKIIMDLASHRTTDNILRNRAFTVAVADAEHYIEADYLGLVSGNVVPDKLARAGLHSVNSDKVNAPIIEEFPITLECKLLKVTDEGLVGEIVNVCADERVLDENGQIDPTKLHAITYDPVRHTYIKLGETIGNAFSDGAQLKQ
jgi:flavin reductase (DIM6/NTAB) family NADH-FMN oxidoreductase RutF